MTGVGVVAGIYSRPASWLPPDNLTVEIQLLHLIDFSPGLWEQLNNPNFQPIEFDGLKKQAGLNSFILRISQRRML